MPNGQLLCLRGKCRAYAHAHGLTLAILTVYQAHQLGSAVFGDLLEADLTKM